MALHGVSSRAAARFLEKPPPHLLLYECLTTFCNISKIKSAFKILFQHYSKVYSHVYYIFLIEMERWSYKAK